MLFKSFSVIFFVCYILHIFQVSAQFTEEPASVTQAEGLPAVFNCSYHEGFAYHWEVLQGVDISHDSHQHGDTSTLSIPATPEHNNTVVQCRFFVGDQLMNSENVTLQVQGALQAVTNLTVTADPSSCSELALSWTAPFSLNLTTADPDIQYCVDVYNVTGGGSHHLDSACGITDTKYTYTAPDPTGVYNFTVTPRSNIQGSLNGTTSQPVLFSYAPNQITDFEVSTNVKLDPFFLIPLSDEFLPCRQPQKYSVEAITLDQNNSTVVCDCPVSEGTHGLRRIDCSDCAFERHKKYNFTIHSDGVPAVFKIISTHDVQKVTIDQTKSEIRQFYINNSTGRGSFIIFSSNNHRLYRVVSRNGSEPSTIVRVPELENDVYRLAIYDLNSTGMVLVPELQPALLLDDIMIPENSSEPTSNGNDVNPNITVTFKNGRICLVCSTPGQSECVGVIHSASPETYNLTVVTAIASAEVCTLERFQGEVVYAVFVGDGSNNVLKSVPSLQGTVNMRTPGFSKYIVAGIVIGISIFVLVIVGSIGLIVYSYNQHRKTRKVEIDNKVYYNSSRFASFLSCETPWQN